MSEVFISYSTQDSHIANAICHVIEENGIRCWIAPRDITGGRIYASEIVKAIKDVKIVLVVVSEKSNKSQHVLNEINIAVENNKIILPFKIDSSLIKDEFSYYLNKTHWIDAFPEPQNLFSTLVKNVSVLLNKKLTEDTLVSLLDQEYEKQTNYDMLRKKAQEQRFAFVMSIDESSEEEIDSFHYYENIVRLDVVDSLKNCWSSYRFLTIKNVSEYNTYCIIHKECGENKTEFQKMRVRARLNDIKGERLSVKSMTRIQPNFIQVFKIYFDKPLKPGESIRIFYRLDWPNEPDAYFMEKLSQSISLARYSKGVGRLEFGIFEPCSIAISSMSEIDELYRESESKIYPQMLMVEKEKRLGPLHEKELYGIKYIVENVKAISYRIFYKLSNTIQDEDEDDFF